MELVYNIDFLRLASAILEIVYSAIVENRLRLVVKHLIFFGVTFVYSQHLLVVNEYLWGQALNNPIMHKGIKRRNSSFRIPVKTAPNKVLERITLTHKYFI